MVIIQACLPRLTLGRNPWASVLFFCLPLFHMIADPIVCGTMSLGHFFLLVVIWMWSFDWNYLCKHTTCTKSWVWEESLGITTGIYDIY